MYPYLQIHERLQYMDEIIACTTVTPKFVFSDSWDWRRCWKEVWFNVFHVVDIKVKRFLVVFSFFPDLQQNCSLCCVCKNVIMHYWSTICKWPIFHNFNVDNFIVLSNHNNSSNCHGPSGLLIQSYDTMKGNTNVTEEI